MTANAPTMMTRSTGISKLAPRVGGPSLRRPQADSDAAGVAVRFVGQRHSYLHGLDIVYGRGLGRPVVPVVLHFKQARLVRKGTGGCAVRHSNVRPVQVDLDRRRVPLHEIEVRGAQRGRIDVELRRIGGGAPAGAVFLLPSPPRLAPPFARR